MILILNNIFEKYFWIIFLNNIFLKIHLMEKHLKKYYLNIVRENDT